MEEIRLRDEINSLLEEFGGDESKAKIFVKVRKTIIEQLDVDPSEVTLDSHIYGDLGADDFEYLGIVMELEEEFDMEIPDPGPEYLYTLKEIVDYIAQRKAV